MLTQCHMLFLQFLKTKANCEQKHIISTNSVSKENPYLKTSKMNYYNSVKYLYQNSPSAHMNSFTPSAAIRGKLSFSVAQYYSCEIYFLKWLTKVFWWNVMTFFVQIIKGKCTCTNLPWILRFEYNAPWLAQPKHLSFDTFKLEQTIYMPCCLLNNTS